MIAETINLKLEKKGISLNLKITKSMWFKLVEMANKDNITVQEIIRRTIGRMLDVAFG